MAAEQASISWDQIPRQPASWHGTPLSVATTCSRISDTPAAGRRISTWQPIAAADRAKLAVDRASDDSTIDNGATVTQLRLLARVHAIRRIGSRRRFSGLTTCSPRSIRLAAGRSFPSH
jgi:hypothetical protein